MNLTILLKNFFKNKKSKILLFLCLIILSIFSLLKINSSVISYNFFAFHEFGTLDRYISNVISTIENKKLSYDEFYPLWQSISPGLFYLIDKFFYSISQNFKLVMLAHSIFGFSGLILFHKNITTMFNKFSANIAIILLSTSPFMIFYSATIHEPIINFFFLNLFIFFFFKLKAISIKNNLLLFFLIFLSCSNYWYNYIFIQIFLIYYYFIKKEKVSFFILIAPVIVLIFYIILSANTYSSFVIVEKFLGRSFDIRIGSNFGNLERILHIKSFLLYPLYLDHRIRTMLNFGILEIIILFSFIKYHNIKIKNFELVLILLIASLFWYILFPQHTLIHYYSGKYAYFGMVAAYGIFISNIFLFLDKKKFKINIKSYLFLFFVLIFLIFNISKKIYLFSYNVHNAKKIINEEKLKLCKNNKSVNLDIILSNDIIKKNYNTDSLRILGTKINCK